MKNSFHAPSSKRPPTVALIVDRLSSEYAVQLRRTVEWAASARGVSVLMATGQPLAAPEAAARAQNRIYELVSKERVDGILLVSATVGHYAGPEGLLELCRRYAPLPVCSVGVEVPSIPSLVVDNERGMKLGVEHLIKAHDASRIAFIAGQKNSVESKLRLAGYRQALEEAGLVYDEELVRHGDFTIGTGISCMRDLLASRVKFDSVVAANDDMALGALDVLANAGITVPKEVLVCGFDDINSAHFARPPLSTLRQPMWWMGERAIDSILEQLAGTQVAPIQSGQVDFVRRESCGCGYQVGVTLTPCSTRMPRVADVIQQRFSELNDVARAAATIPNGALKEWPERLIRSLEDEFTGHEGRFSEVFEDILEQAQSKGASLDEFQRVVSVMRSEFRKFRVESGEDERHLERVWHNARVLVGAASIRALGRQKLEQQEVAAWLSQIGESLSTTLSLPLLREKLMDALPRLQIRTGAVSLYVPGTADQLRPLMAIVDGKPLPDSGGTFSDRQLAPEEVFQAASHCIVLPLTFEAEMLGVAVFESGTMASVYETLRQQIGSAIKGASMHREMVTQVTVRQRLEAERIASESRLAAEIQTSMHPPVLAAPCLEMAALSEPAAEAGGDYYDVLSAKEGAWLAIGDVTGHGLASGLVMLMLQSMIAALSRQEAELPPSAVVSAVGDAIWNNVRERLKRDDHATLTVLRYHEGGKFVFAGAHEDLIIWRKRAQRCETIATPGFWVGAIPSVRTMTEDCTFELEPGDLLVLHTDGITEARNAQNQQFSLERLISCVEAAAGAPVQVVRDRIQEAVRDWSPTVEDDRTLLVARFLGTA